MLPVPEEGRWRLTSSGDAGCWKRLELGLGELVLGTGAEAVEDGERLLELRARGLEIAGSRVRLAEQAQGARPLSGLADVLGERQRRLQMGDCLVPALLAHRHQ